MINSTERELVGVVGEADHGGIETGVVDEEEIGAIGYGTEGIVEKVECKRGNKEQEEDVGDKQNRDGFRHPYKLGFCRRKSRRR